MSFEPALASRVSNLLGGMEELLQEAASLGSRSTAATELAEAIEEIRARLELSRSQPPPGRLQALLAELFVLTYELRPTALKSYGDLSPEQSSFFEHEAARLTALAGKALDELELKPKMEVK